MDSFPNSVSYSNQALCFNSETPALVITNNTGKTGLIFKGHKALAVPGDAQSALALFCHL